MQPDRLPYLNGFFFFHLLLTYRSTECTPTIRIFVFFVVLNACVVLWSFEIIPFAASFFSICHSLTLQGFHQETSSLWKRKYILGKVG